MNNPTPIAPLTKVGLELDVIPSAAEASPLTERFKFSFVCGLAIEGLTEFEKRLQGKITGDKVRLLVEPHIAGQLFEHLGSAFMAALPVDPPFQLTMEVVSVAPVSERELVKALAEKTESGPSACGCDGGGCGCG